MTKLYNANNDKDGVFNGSSLGEIYLFAQGLSNKSNLEYLANLIVKTTIKSSTQNDRHNLLAMRKNADAALMDYYFQISTALLKAYQIEKMALYLSEASKYKATFSKSISLKEKLTGATGYDERQEALEQIFKARLATVKEVLGNAAVPVFKGVPNYEELSKTCNITYFDEFVIKGMCQDDRNESVPAQLVYRTFGTSKQETSVCANNGDYKDSVFNYNGNLVCYLASPIWLRNGKDTMLVAEIADIDSFKNSYTGNGILYFETKVRGQKQLSSRDMSIRLTPVGSINGLSWGYDDANFAAFVSDEKSSYSSLEYDETLGQDCKLFNKQNNEDFGKVVYANFKYQHNRYPFAIKLTGKVSVPHRLIGRIGIFSYTDYKITAQIGCYLSYPECSYDEKTNSLVYTTKDENVVRLQDNGGYQGFWYSNDDYRNDGVKAKISAYVDSINWKSSQCPVADKK